MNDRDPPVNAVFAIQRSAIERTHDALVAGIGFQRDVNRELGRDLDPARDLNEFEGDLVRNGAGLVFGTLADTAPEGSGLVDLFESVEEAVVDLEDSETEAIAEAIDSLEEGLQDGSESVDDALADTTERLDEAVADLLEATDDANDRTADAVADLRDELAARAEDGDEAAA